MPRPRSRLLAFLLLGVCRPSGPEPFDGSVEMFFRPEVGDAYFRCNETYPLGKGSLSPVDLHFYVYDVRLVTADGAEHAVELAEEPPFQQNGWALLDFADDLGTCESDATLNKTIKGTVDWDGAATDFTGVKFRLGKSAGGSGVFFSAASTDASVVLGAGTCAGDGPEIALDGYDVTSSAIAVDWKVLVDPGVTPSCTDDASGCASRCVPGRGVAWVADENTNEPAVFRVE